MTVRISVCIPVWNDLKWIGGAIESVLAQTYQDWELVIADNASDEDIGSVVARYDDRRIRYHRANLHTEIYENFNRASQLGQFEWIQPMSADDRLHPDCLARIAERIEEAQDSGQRLAAVLTDCERVDSEGRPAFGAFTGHQRVEPIPDGIYTGSQWLDIMSVPRQAPWNIGSLAFSRDIMVESGWFRPDIGYGADLELVLRVAAYGSVVYIDEKLFFYTVRDASDSFSRSRKALQCDMTPMRAAWVSALAAHTRDEPLAAEQHARISKTMARSHIQRSLQQRLWSQSNPWRSAALDVGRGLAIYPRLLLSPRHLVAMTLALLGPRWAVSFALRRLAVHRRGAEDAATPSRV